MKRIIFFILIIALIVGAAWFFSQKPVVKPAPVSEIISGVPSRVYQNKDFGFRLSYPEGAEIRSEMFEGYLPVTQTGAVGMYLPQSLFDKTNLAEAGVFVGISPRPDAVRDCQIVGQGEANKDLGMTMINGAPFHGFQGVGAGAGNYYDLTIYRTVKNGSCYEIVELLHSGNINNYPPGTVAEFDKAKFSGILETMARTFTFTDNAGSGVMGVVQLGPPCPVERIPPDPRCAPRGYKTTIEISKQGSQTVVATTKSDEAGRFKIDLAAGAYAFHPKGGNVMPRCDSETIQVKPHSFTYATLSCDTGIR